MRALPSTIASGEPFLSVLPPTAAVALPLPRLPALHVSDEAPAVFRRAAWTNGQAGISEAGDDPSVADGLGLAHDAGNLLGAIRLYCDLLALPGVLRSEHRHYAEELRQLTARSGSMIDRLLRPGSLLGAGEDAARRPAERIRPEAVVRECRAMLDTVAKPGSLLIAVEAGAGGEVTVPREALERILVNLIKNAREAGGCAEEQGTITVRVRSVAAWGADRAAGIAVGVEDCGHGMDEAAVRAALSPTFSAVQQRPGRGLGLCVVRELTARTGGELRMRSRLGQGTTVEIVWAAVAPERAESG